MKFWSCLYAFAFVKFVEFTILEHLGHVLLALVLLILAVGLWHPRKQPTPWYLGISWLGLSDILIVINLEQSHATKLLLWSVLGLIAFEMAHPQPPDEEEKPRQV